VVDGSGLPMRVPDVGIKGASLPTSDGWRARVRTIAADGSS